jgi:hypothetical protein
MEAVYFEPADQKEDAWDTTRMQYDMRLATYDGEQQTVFQVARYRGGRLDWFDFHVQETNPVESHSNPILPDEDFADVIKPPPIKTIPMRTRFEGMPAPRLWQFEDRNVNLSAIGAAGDELSRLMLLEFMLTAGDDWFSIPLTVPVGTLTRIKNLTVTDTFGETQEVTHTYRQSNRKNWSMFSFDTHPTSDTHEPALFLPSIPGELLQGPAIETVIFVRDEIANLVFAIEKTFEGALARPIDRSQFDLPRLRILHVERSASGELEFIDFENGGDDELIIDGWTVEQRQSNDTTTELHKFTNITLPPRSTLRLLSGGDQKLDTAILRHTGRPPTTLADQDEIVIMAGQDTVLVYPVMPPVASNLERYQLVSEVDDHWFPYVHETDDSLLHPAYLLDANALQGNTVIPRAYGKIIRFDSEGDSQASGSSSGIQEAVINREGLVITRNYQLVSWYNGQRYLWASRRVTTGHGERYSGLAFDFLKPPVDSSE